MKFTLEVEKHFETKSIFALTKIRMWLLCGGPPHCSTPRSVLLKHLGGTFFLPRPPDPQTRKRTISRGSLLAAPRFQTQFCIHQPQILKTKLKSPRKEKAQFLLSQRESHYLSVQEPTLSFRLSAPPSSPVLGDSLSL